MTDAGQTAVIVPVPGSRAGRVLLALAIRRVRRDAGPYQRALSVPEERLSDDALTLLKHLCGMRPTISVAFRHTARFTRVLYLDPEPADELPRLTLDIASAWREVPPYGGASDDVVPHLTVAHDVTDDVLDRVSTDVAGRLPISTKLGEAQLCAFDGRYWHIRTRLPFGS